MSPDRTSSIGLRPDRVQIGVPAANEGIRAFESKVPGGFGSLGSIARDRGGAIVTVSSIETHHFRQASRTAPRFSPVATFRARASLWLRVSTSAL